MGVGGEVLVGVWLRKGIEFGICLVVIFLFMFVFIC